MKNKCDVIKDLLQSKQISFPKEEVLVFAPSNIALVKYWGKRDTELNLPQTSSLSVTIPKKGANTRLKLIDAEQDHIILNGEALDAKHPFAIKAADYLTLFRPITKRFYQVNSDSNIPIAAGLASSASGFAALVMALNELHQWQLGLEEQSILARMGSGSACRSFWPGFVEWHKGQNDDGMDSHGEPFNVPWPDLCLGVSLVSEQIKPVSSRDGMNRTTQTSPFYPAWPNKVEQDLENIKQAIYDKNFHRFGQVVESNALAMHATMMSAWPPILYWLPETVEHMHRVWQLRQQGIGIYFTQDAGPNLKFLFMKQQIGDIQKQFPMLEVVALFSKQ